MNKSDVTEFTTRYYDNIYYIYIYGIASLPGLALTLIKTSSQTGQIARCMPMRLSNSNGPKFLHTATDPWHDGNIHADDNKKEAASQRIRY